MLDQQNPNQNDDSMDKDFDFGNENDMESTGSKGGMSTGSDSDEDTRGFASMDPDKQRKIASKGGKAAHKSGHAHEWNSEEASEAGRKGGQS